MNIENGNFVFKFEYGDDYDFFEKSDYDYDFYDDLGNIPVKRSIQGMPELELFRVTRPALDVN